MQYADIDIDDIIIKLFNGSASVSETMTLAKWLGQSEENRQYFERQRAEWNLSDGAVAASAYDCDAAYNRFEAFVRRKEPESHCDDNMDDTSRRYLGLTTINKSWRRWALRAVACVAGLLLIMSGTWFAYDNYTQRYAARFAGMVNVEAPAGSRAKLALPDGTVVWLNAGSKLSYSRGFGVTDRRVHLDGEGYFEVGRKSDLPMTVCSDNIRVRDIGTKFNFRDYPEEPMAEVTLCEGEVGVTSVKRPGVETVIRPEQMTLVDKRTGRITTTSCYSADKRLWTSGELVMDGMSIHQITNIIARAYKVRFVIASGRVGHLQLCGTLNLDRENLDEILSVIAKVGNISYNVSGKTVTLK